MIKSAPHILDQYERPIPRSGKPRQELIDAFVQAQNEKPRRLAAKYDAAGSGTEYSNIWGNTDAFDADSAHSRAVREKLVHRSRYECGSNGFSSGINSTWANDLVGTGPTLRMQTGSEGFNRMIESEWRTWAKEVKFRRKLWCLAHAYGQDGEGIGILRLNRGLRHRIKLDFQLVETEQCQTPQLPYGQRGYIDGIRFDSFGNPLWYDILQDHPGSSWSITSTAEQVPARLVAHWFKLRRPGQHRGVPESTSTLNVGAAARRYREAVIAGAENIADFSLFIKTTLDPDQVDSVSPMSTLDIQKRMMTALPAGYDAFQPRAEQPTANYESFHKSLVNEQARPRSMPLNKAMCDSSDYNFASGRLDHSTYYGSLDVDREDCNDLVLDAPVFDTWFDQAVLVFGWLGGDPTVISEAAKAHTWDWPKHQVADIKSEATANQTKLQSGQTSLPSIYSDSGKDYEDEVLSEATANGITVEQQKQINVLRNVPAHAINQVAAVLGIATAVDDGIEDKSNNEPDEADDDE
jgi:capsid protein